MGDYADPQLKSDVLVIRSRIYRYQRRYAAAWQEADAALKQVRDYSYAELSGKANGLIARGEASLAEAADLDLAVSKMRREQLLERAYKDFTQAADIGGKSPTVSGAVGLHLANIFAMRGDLPGARLQFQEAWLTIQRIENGWVHQLAHEVRQRVEFPSSVFMLDVKQLEKNLADGASLYKAVEANLRDFMIERAQMTDAGVARSPEEAARYLGKSRPTFYTWLHQSKSKPDESAPTSRPSKSKAASK